MRKTRAQLEYDLKWYRRWTLIQLAILAAVTVLKVIQLIAGA
jgi:hypothetical protein